MIKWQANGWQIDGKMIENGWQKIIENGWQKMIEQWLAKND